MVVFHYFPITTFLIIHFRDFSGEMLRKTPVSFVTMTRIVMFLEKNEKTAKPVEWLDAKQVECNAIKSCSQNAAKIRHKF